MRRLSDVVGEYDRLEAQLREVDDRNASAIGPWIASGREGPAPDDSDAKSLTAAMVALRPELAAARHTLPEKEQQHQAAIERLIVAAADRDAALEEVAVLVANDVAGELTDAINKSLSIEARLLGLHSNLIERVRDHTNSRAAHAAERIAVIIRAAKRSAGVRHNAESGRRLLAALCEDPMADLK